MRLIVIGGGAAGFFCAINAAAADPSLEVILVEKSSKLLSKVRISGGGRCNVTHACFDLDLMSRSYPRGQHFVRKAFHEFFTTHTISWFRERGVELKIESDGRMFPVSDSSQTIIDCLINEANRRKVEIRMNHEIKTVVKHDSRFRVLFANGKEEVADFICIATGGYPKTQMFDWLKETGHKIEDPVPSLFTFNIPGNDITQLMGVSVPNAQVKIQGTKLVETGPLLITHWGLSGPCVLRLSAWGARELQKLNYNFNITVSWTTDLNEPALREFLAEQRTSNSSAQLSSRPVIAIPQRLWAWHLQRSDIPPNLRWADLSSSRLNSLVRHLLADQYEVRGKTTFKEEFVTAGGIRLKEIDAHTMESRLLPNLFFAGEVMDVDGITGGFNFQHAWTSGWIAARSISGRSRGGGSKSLFVTG